MLRRASRGDTLIEVLFAVSVFSFVVVGSLAIMNQGTAASQRSLEITVARQEIDSQAETLRFLHNSYLAVYQPGITFVLNDATTSPAEEWYRIVNSGISANQSPSALTNGATCITPPARSFILDTQTVRYNGNSTTLQPAVTYPQLVYNAGVLSAQGLWIEAIPSRPSTDVNQADAGYIDFHIRSCWQAPGMDIPMTVATIVRLYVPR